MSNLVNTLDKTTPSGSEKPRLGDDKIRQFKESFVEIMTNDHYMPLNGSVVESADAGEHTLVTLREQAADPTTPVADKGVVYSKDVSGVTELAYYDSAGNKKTVTSAGKLNITSADITQAVISLLLPSGIVIPYSAAAAPTGWLICDGTAQSRTTYSALFAVIGTTYGVGDGSTTFNLPNAKSKVIVGYDSGQTLFNTLAKTGGELSHVLSSTEMPSHSHTITAGSDNGNSGYMGVNATNNTDHSTVTGSTGGGFAHNNVQPYLTLNYIIKT